MPFGRWAGVPKASAAPTLALAAVRLEQALGPQASGDDWRWAAIARLATGDAPTALTWLDRAEALSPTDAGSACDRAGVHYVQGLRTNDFEQIAHAIDAARRGITRSAKHPGCWFNLGLSLRHVGLASMAAEAFATAAQLDSGDWSREASAAARPVEIRGREDIAGVVEPAILGGNLGALAPHFADHVDVIEEVLQRRVLTDWAASLQRGDSAAAALLAKRAGEIATRLHAANGDRHPLELVAQFTRCDRVCAEGWIDHIAGMSAWDSDEIGTARLASERADAAFGTAPSPINAARLPLRVTLARVDRRRDEAMAWLRSYLAVPATSGYLLLSGRLTWQLGLLEAEAGNFGQSVVLYRQAAEWLGRARDREGLAMVDSLLASRYQLLADYRQAWMHAFAAASRLSACRQLRQRAILAASAVLASASGLDAAASAFREPLLKEARRTATAVYLARVLSEDATSLVRLGQLAQASERLAEAERTLPRIDDPGAAAISGALVQIARARRLAVDAPAQAIPIFETVLAGYRKGGNLSAVPVLELERGRALLKAGHVAEAARAFSSGIEAAELERLSAQGDAERVGLLSERWDLYTSLIDLQLQQHNEQTAADLLNRARAVNLLEAVGADQQPPPTLPAGVVALEYLVLPSGVQGWVTDERGRRGFAVASTAAVLERQISDFRAAVIGRRPADEIGRLSGDLFNALFSAVRATIVSASHLVIVPDAALYEVPFAALADPTTGKALIDHASITVTPSLRLYGYDPAPLRVRQAYDLVAMGNPRHAGAQGSAVNLPGADREARAVAALYPRSHLLTGSDITKRRFVELAPRTRVLHFAGHAVADAQAPALSRLLVTPSQEDPLGVVFATDVTRLDLRGVRLVMLSACETAGGVRRRGDGVLSLARAFLRAGVPTVIATLWPISDDRGGSLAEAIHGELLKGMSASDALRQAQLRVRQSNAATTMDWAGTIVLGRDVTTTDHSCKGSC